jgi:hypothetical protein
MSEALEECVFNGRHVICGVEMRPFSIWHFWLLEFVGSPYVGADGGTAADLALALKICSTPASSPIGASLPDFSADPILVEAINGMGILQASLAFQNYLRDFVALPRCWQTGEGRSVKSPVCLYMVAVLMRCGRMGHEEAWSVPFGYARHLVLALAEAGGNEIPLLTPAEESALKEAGYTL